MIKSAVKSILEHFGFEVRRAKTKDPFNDQRMLLNGIGAQVIFDVGAYTGEITHKYKMLFPKATIYSFEPFPDSFRHLKERANAFSQIKAFELAFADKADRRRFYVNIDRTSNSLLLRPSNVRKYYESHAENVSTIEVDTTTIDEFCEKESISRIDILKLDVEGTELLVLQGASGKLEQRAIELIYAEIMFVPHYEQGAMYHELFRFLSDYGYTIFDLYELKRAENGQLRWGNVIFVSPYIRTNVIDRR